jgi:hypothetical protein
MLISFVQPLSGDLKRVESKPKRNFGQIGDFSQAEAALLKLRI